MLWFCLRLRQLIWFFLRCDGGGSDFGSALVVDVAVCMAVADVAVISVDVVLHGGRVLAVDIDVHVKV